MAWIVFDLDNTLLKEDPEMGVMPTEGSLEAVQELMSQGHRLTVYTSRFAPMPASERERLRGQIEEELISCGFPPLEIWTGTTKPSADIFIGDNHVTFDDDWGLALAQVGQMLEDRGLTPPPLPDDGTMPEDPEMSEVEEEMP